jgi:hypothetical protein
VKRILTILCACWSGLGVAGDVDQIQTLTTAEFEAFSKDLVASFSYKAGAPAEPLGVIGFDVGISITATDLKATSAWEKAMSGDESISTLYVPKLYIQKGLPLGIDVGAFYFTIPNSNLEAWGAEIKYAIIDGSTVMPAVAVRGGISKMLGADQITVESNSLDVSISKGFLVLMPYAGVGRVWATSTPEGTAAAVLNEISLSESKVFVGLGFQPGIFNMAFERDTTASITSYTFKMGLAF